MRIRVNGESYEMRPHSLEYPNDLLNGILLDSDDICIYLTDHMESHRGYMEEIPDDELNFYDMSEEDIDYDEEPHSLIVRSLGRLIVESAEKLLEQA